MSKKTCFFFLGVAVLYVEIVASCGHKGNKWDRLLVNFAKPTAFPLTEDQALKEGWRNDATCDSDNPFYGNRYAKGSDISSRLLFDSSGKLAGIQTTITGSDQLIPSPTRPRPSLFVPDDHGNYLLTAYFTNKPRDICKKKKRRRRHAKDEDTLILQMSDVRRCKPQFMEIPLDEKKLGNTKWLKGKCFEGMGVHYWYDISLEMHCDQALPVFVLYDQTSQRLKAFGWLTPANITSPFWEHPPAQVLQLFMKEVPKCAADLAQRKLISTQHVYLTDPSKLICTTP